MHTMLLGGNSCEENKQDRQAGNASVDAVGAAVLHVEGKPLWLKEQSCGFLVEEHSRKKI